MFEANEEETARIAGRLIAYLREELETPTLAYASPLTPLLGGSATAVYRFALEGVPEKLNRPLVLRLYPEFIAPENALWEFIIQNTLASQGHPVATARWLCTDTSILGGAFFVMDFLSGEPLLSAPAETLPGILASAHAALHEIDPGPFVKALNEQGIDERAYGLDTRIAGLKEMADELAWMGDGADWLIENRPPEPGRLAICHGDFHPLNILIQDGRVSGVLDWPGLLVADPALDVANTLMLSTVIAPRVASFPLGQAFAPVDWEVFSQQYLDAYRAERALDETPIAYYQALQSARALMDGFGWHGVFDHPSVVEGLTETIRGITGIRITMPD